MATILIVDDVASLRGYISKMLVGAGHEIIEAENGVRAVATYQQVRPDLVLMDTAMPEMDGLTAVKEIRAYDPRARIIMLTALGQESVVLEAINHGAVDFILKPFDRNCILNSINKLLN